MSDTNAIMPESMTADNELDWYKIAHILLTDKLRDALRRLAEVEADNRWIPVKERMPETGRPCWVVYAGHVQHIAYCRQGKGFACADGYEWRSVDDIDCDAMPDSFVTHWRPLPTAPPTDSTPAVSEDKA